MRSNKRPDKSCFKYPNKRKKRQPTTRNRYWGIKFDGDVPVETNIFTNEVEAHLWRQEMLKSKVGPFEHRRVFKIDCRDPPRYLLRAIMMQEGLPSMDHAVVTWLGRIGIEV